MANVWAVLKFLAELWEQIKILLGMIEKAKHEKKQDEIADNAGKVGNPDLSDEEREDATQNLEDIVNRNT